MSFRFRLLSSQRTTAAIVATPTKAPITAPAIVPPATVLVSAADGAVVLEPEGDVTELALAEAEGLPALLMALGSVNVGMSATELKLGV